VATILFGMLPHYGHHNATFKLARDLVTRGHRVVYISIDETMRAQVERQGFAYQHIPLLSEECLKASGLLAGIGRIRALRDALADGERLRALIGPLGGDLLLVDVGMAAFAVALAPLGMPIMLCNSFMAHDKVPNVPPLTSGLMPGHDLIGRLKVEAAWLRERLRGALYLPLLGPLGLTERQIVRHIAARTGALWGMRPHGMRTFGLGLGLPEIVLCPAALDFPRPPAPHLHFSGPGVLEDRKEPAFDFGPGGSGRPLVYCSRGTLVSGFAGHRATLQAVLDAVAGLPDVDLLMAVGEHIDPQSFGPQPPRIRLVRHVPQIAALRRAAVFITHGGMNSIKESILCGVPMLVLSSPSADLPGNAARVVWHGLGLRIASRRITAEGVRAGLIRLLGDGGFRDRMAVMRDLFRTEEERMPAVRIVEDILSKGSSHSTNGRAPGLPRITPSVSVFCEDVVWASGSRFCRSAGNSRGLRRFGRSIDHHASRLSHA
jgi:UDP:flavonoid glycosyltransferase YjiC (YdhE family)